ncbi:MAG: hypothetical protein JWM57_1390, partial [Phycisphaerales bacterium]|nr:hypothetical protein [Phycisphaerales bacterium]
MNLTVGKRLTMGFATLTALTLGIGGVAVYEFRNLDRLAGQIASDSLPGTAAAGSINA